ncbi:hypothetical protein [Gemmatimonas sp.]|uniref:hypothetical protein n=1 Tax=Gemmatimonas sp. TaxID=1962908 RepID=UPI00333E3FA2
MFISADSLGIGPAHDWVDWTGLSFTVVGTVLTIGGLVFTFLEARSAKQRAGEAKTAANAARDAAAAAMSTVTERITISDLGELRRALTSVVSTLESNKLEIALHEIRYVRLRVGELRERRGFEDHKVGVQELVVDLAAIQSSLEAKLYQPDAAEIDLSTISTTLWAHMDKLSGWSEQMRFQQPAENQT